MALGHLHELIGAATQVGHEAAGVARQVSTKAGNLRNMYLKVMNILTVMVTYGGNWQA